MDDRMERFEIENGTKWRNVHDTNNNSKQQQPHRPSIESLEMEVNCERDKIKTHIYTTRYVIRSVTGGTAHGAIRIRTNYSILNFWISSLVNTFTELKRNEKKKTANISGNGHDDVRTELILVFLRPNAKTRAENVYTRFMSA